MALSGDKFFFSMDDWDDGICLDVVEVESLVDIFVELANHGDVVASDNVEAKNDLNMKGETC